MTFALRLLLALVFAPVAAIAVILWLFTRPSPRGAL